MAYTKSEQLYMVYLSQLIITNQFISASNNLFFNLWSACLMSRGNASWVTSSATWQDRCQEKDVQFNDSMQYSTTSSIPPWAYQSMPKNGSFDILAAVRCTCNFQHSTILSYPIAVAESANPESSNSRLQVVIPVVVGVAVAFVCCTVFWLYRRRFLTMASNSSPKAVAPYNASHFHISVLPRTRKVHETSRDDLWVIDRDERLHSESFQLIPTPRSGHVRLQSSSPEALLLDLDAKPIRTNTDRLYTTISSFFTFWKPKPVRVKSRLPGPRFDIDAENADLKGRSLLKKPRRQKHSSAKPTSRRPDEDNDSEDEEYRQLPGAEDVDPLIPRSSPLPSVLLISRRGTNFTLSSIDTASAQIQVVPPSPEVWFCLCLDFNADRPSRPPRRVRDLSLANATVPIREPHLHQTIQRLFLQVVRIRLYVPPPEVAQIPLLALICLRRIITCLSTRPTLLTSSFLQAHRMNPFGPFLRLHLQIFHPLSIPEKRPTNLRLRWLLGAPDGSRGLLHPFSHRHLREM